MAGLATSTKRVYATGYKRYTTFCDCTQLAPFPASESTLQLFVSYLHQEGLSFGTIKSYLAAIRFEQIAQNLGNPNIHLMFRLEYVLKGIKRSTTTNSRPRLPITPEILLSLRPIWQQLPIKQNAKMLWAASNLCFFGFLCSGEAVAPYCHEYDPRVTLCYSDICVDSKLNPSMIQVRIKASKTDPFRQGVSLYLGATGKQLCPVVAVLSYMVERGNSPGPLFQWQDGTYLTRDSFVHSLREALSLAGYPPEKFAGHSFRIGAATTAACCGIPESLIQTLGCWHSSAYIRYIQTSPDTLKQVSLTLLSRLCPS